MLPRLTENEPHEVGDANVQFCVLKSVVEVIYRGGNLVHERRLQSAVGYLDDETTKDMMHRFDTLQIIRLDADDPSSMFTSRATPMEPGYITDKTTNTLRIHRITEVVEKTILPGLQLKLGITEPASYGPPLDDTSVTRDITSPFDKFVRTYPSGRRQTIVVKHNERGLPVYNKLAEQAPNQDAEPVVESFTTWTDSPVAIPKEYKSYRYAHDLQGFYEEISLKLESVKLDDDATTIPPFNVGAGLRDWKNSPERELIFNAKYYPHADNAAIWDTPLSSTIIRRRGLNRSARTN